ncbi:hypothetical protein M8C21_010469 [Ambrosia artemisiifolia]|uniref:BHLH domain-containing protein n=1 Tax=Ambrosia artemisiifolia TaxID=4212 RepID=A0AAD5C3N6_AMBAR|nr:hypothetical protein M8C21_010469 [Ambrosia artemisiifolia]
MADEVSYDDAWWATHSWFTPNENVGDQQMLEHANEQKITVDANMCNENQIMKQANDNNQVVLSHGDKKETEDGDVTEKRNGKEIIDGDNIVPKRSRKGVVGFVWKRNGIGISVRRRCSSNLSAERRRRNTETKLYGELLALLPHLTVKDPKTKILEEAKNCIESLEETLRNLEKQKLERLNGASQTLVSNTESPNLLINKGASGNLDAISEPSSISFKTYVSSHVTLNVCGEAAVISICSERIPDLFTTVCYILEEHNMEVVYTEISSDHAKTMYMIRVGIRGNVPPELVEGFPYEEMYSKAVAQIEQLVTFQN